MTADRCQADMARPNAKWGVAAGRRGTADEGGTVPATWLIVLSQVALGVAVACVAGILMQIGMVLGFFTSWPVNAWLIRRGIKEAM